LNTQQLLELKLTLPLKWHPEKAGMNGTNGLS
jgi:hypothetical protein